MKKIITVIICFIVVFATTLGLTGRHYNVFASTDYNIFDIVVTEIIPQNANYTLTDTGFIIETKIAGNSASYINCYYKLLPNIQFVLRWNAEKLVDGSSNTVYVWGSRDQVLGYANDGNETIFTTDETGTGRFLFYSKTGMPNDIYKTEYSNIYLGFVDETLGAVYMEAYNSGYNSGYYEGASPYEENWEVFIFEDDSLIDRRWKENHTIENPGSQGNYYRSSALLILPLGYYRVEQRFLDYTGINRPRFFDPAYSFERDFPPILYLDENSSPPIYLSLDFAGDLNDDRYIYFSVPYDNCQVRFQFVANAGEFTAWSASYTSLYQLIELSYDANFNIRYYEIFKRGYDVGKNEGYTEGKNDGIEAGYWNGYNDGREVGSNEGYNVGYNEGYNIGFNKGSSSSITTNWFTSFINSIFNIFNVEIFPNVKLIYLIFIPLGLGVIALIFKLIRG